MIGNLEPEENVMKERFPSADMLGQLAVALGKMDWSADDELRVKIGGVANSGIHQTEGANPKWAKPYGTTSYQTEYATIKTGLTLSTFSSDINTGNLRLLAIPTSTDSTTFKIIRTTIDS